jgi:hypothetical protein
VPLQTYAETTHSAVQQLNAHFGASGSSGAASPGDDQSPDDDLLAVCVAASTPCTLNEAAASATARAACRLRQTPTQLRFGYRPHALK